MFDRVMAEILGSESVTYEVSPGAPTGANWVSSVYRITVSNQGQSNFFIKCLPTSEARRTAMQSDVFFRNEAHFYSSVLPEFVKFQEEKCLTSPFHSVATIYHISEDTIVMEYMKTRGYIMLDTRRRSLDVPHIRLVLKELGRFHGLSFAVKDQNPQKFAEMKSSLNETVFTSSATGHFNSILTSGWKAALGIARQTFTKQDMQIIEAFLGNVWDKMATLATPEEPHAVILHGDAFINNILFHYPLGETEETPDKLCLIDFQMTRYGSPALDLSFFLLRYCTEGSAQNYRHLLTVYHDALREFVRELGSNADELFPFSALEEEMQKHSAFGMAMALISIPGTMSEANGSVNEEDSKDASDIIRDICASFENMSEKCERKVVEVLKQAVKCGYMK
jgi:thiamine kinase-like enzyme